MLPRRIPASPVHSLFWSNLKGTHIQPCVRPSHPPVVSSPAACFRGGSFSPFGQPIGCNCAAFAFLTTWGWRRRQSRSQNGKRGGKLSKVYKQCLPPVANSNRLPDFKDQKLWCLCDRTGTTRDEQKKAKRGAAGNSTPVWDLAVSMVCSQYALCTFFPLTVYILFFFFFCITVPFTCFFSPCDVVHVDVL